MYANINKHIGSLLILPLIVLSSLFVSFLSSDDAYAALSGTWKDKSTITVNGVDYKGPTEKSLVTLADPPATGKFKVFSPDNKSGVLYASLTTDLKTTKTINYGRNNTAERIYAETVNLTNTQDSVSAAPGGTTGTSPDTVTDTCAIDGIGWLVCPVSTFLAKVNDGAYSAAEQLLIFRVEDPFNPSGPIYSLWSAVRNVANIVFVIALFVVIFSQATSMGISAYGIRKMLPRIIISAIMVNLSYYLCIFAIDISNIIGASLDGLIGSLPSNAIEKNNTTWEEVTASVLALQFVGGAVVAATIAIGVFATGILAAFLVGSLLAVVTAVAIFMARHVLIIMLIILAPLAFVAYILPNTENLFDKWRKTFIAMLVMYPLVALLFASSKVASSIMISTADATNEDIAWLYKIGALGVLTIPLFGIPWIVKFSGGFIGRVAGMVNDRGKGVVDRARNAANEGAKARRKDFGANAALGRYGRRTMKGFETNPDGSIRYGADGKPIKSQGAKARFKRGADLMGGGAIQAVAQRSGDKKWERENRSREAERAIMENRFERLNETADVPLLDDNGQIRRDESGKILTVSRPTTRAGKLAQNAAGVGGAEGVARIQRLASEQKRKEFIDEVGRKNADWNAGGAYDSGAVYTDHEFNNDTQRYELKRDNQGKLVFHQDHGKAMAAVAKGLDVGYIKAGQAATEENALKQVMRGSEGAIAQNTAMKHIADIGDAAAINHALYGPNALSDSQVSDFMQWIASNPGGIGSKLSHILTKDQGLTGVNGSKMAAWHGTEFKVAASRIRQLREAGDDKSLGLAKSIEDAVTKSYENLSTDSNLAQDFNQKHVDAIKDFNAIVSGATPRYRLREYGDLESTDVTITSGVPERPTIINLDTAGKVSERKFDLSLRPEQVPPSTSVVSSSSPRDTPSSDPGVLQVQREAGGNSEGFRYESPEAQTPPIGGTSDAQGRFTPNRPDGSPMSPDEADEYHRRNGEG